MRLKRIAATAAATFTLAATVVGFSAPAQASTGNCAVVSAYGTTGYVCIGSGGSETIDVYSYGASTDVRVYGWEQDSCGHTEATFNVHAWPGNEYHQAEPPWSCGPWRASAEITESGRNVSHDTSSWTWG